MHSGARQHRAECDCLPEVAEERHSQPWVRMHSQVSKANHEFFISEGRVDDSLTAEDLLERWEEADGTLIVCNVCGSIKEVGS